MGQGLLYVVQPGGGGGVTKKVLLSYAFSSQMVPLSLDFLKVVRFSFPVSVVGPSAKVELSLSRSLLQQKTKNLPLVFRARENFELDL